jgi:ParB family transcriptional regulator, chromosome partitioning protein
MPEPTTTTQCAAGTLLRIPLVQLVPGPNVRGRDLGDIDELALSLKVLGQLEPILVCDIGYDRYQIKEGYRRYRAAPKAELRTLLALVVDQADPATTIEQQLAMHTHSRDFDPMAQAAALHRLMFEHKRTREQISRALGKSPAWVRDRISLVHLKPNEQQAVAAGRMSVGQALGLLRIRRDERSGGTPPSTRTDTPAATAATTRTQTIGAQHCPTCYCGRGRG